MEQRSTRDRHVPPEHLPTQIATRSLDSERCHRLAHASCSNEIAQPRSVRIEDWLSFVISIGISPAEWIFALLVAIVAAIPPLDAVRSRSSATFLACERRYRFAVLDSGGGL